MSKIFDMRRPYPVRFLMSNIFDMEQFDAQPLVP